MLLLLQEALGFFFVERTREVRYTNYIYSSYDIWRSNAMSTKQNHKYILTENFYVNNISSY